MLREHVHGDVTGLELSSPVGRGLGYRVHAYVWRDTLIDTGFPRSARQLGDWIARRALSLEGAVVTHWHEDHAGGVPALARRGLPLALHPWTLVRLREGPRLELYRRVTWGSPAALDVPVREWQPNDLELLHTPGHSPDHRVVWDARSGTLFAGDLFLGVKTRIAHADEDLAQLLVSLRRCAALDPARMFCGHRGLVPEAAAMLRAKADWLEETIARVAAAAARGLSDRAIVREVFGREELTGLASFGHYSRRAFVRAARRAAGGPPNDAPGGTR